MKEFRVIMILLISLWVLFSCSKAKHSKDDEKISSIQQVEQSYQNEPDGFRNMKWGTSLLISEFQWLPTKKYTLDDTLDSYIFKMDCIFFDGSEGDIYTNENNKLSFGDAKVKAIRYYTCRGDLYEVDIYGDGYSFVTVKDALIYKFGQPHETKNDNEYETYSWKGSKTNINLRFRESQQNPFEGHQLTLYSPMHLKFSSAAFDDTVRKAREKYDMQKTKKTAKDF